MDVPVFFNSAQAELKDCAKSRSELIQSNFKIRRIIV